LVGEIFLHRIKIFIELTEQFMAGLDDFFHRLACEISLPVEGLESEALEHFGLEIIEDS
jgi:hypothetical protein